MWLKVRKLVVLWEATQVELHGRYSSNRVLELAKYTKEASWVRVVGVVVSTPLPCLIVTILVDVLPLADPSKGVDANVMFFVRAFCSYLVMNFLSIQQFRTSVPALPYPMTRVFGNTIVISTLCVAVYYGLAETIGFPVPFSIVTVMPAWVTFISVSMTIEWAKEIAKVPKAAKMVVNVMKEWMCEVLLVLIYPPYFYIFTTLSETQQMAFALLLPVIKIIMRNIFVRTVVHLRDGLPEVVIFNVEVFNALFVSYCMQNSPSIWTTLELMAADLILLALSLRDMEAARHALEDLERRTQSENGWTRNYSLSGDSNGRARATLERASIFLRHENRVQYAWVSPFAQSSNQRMESKKVNPHHNNTFTAKKPSTIVVNTALITSQLGPVEPTLGKNVIHPIREDAIDSTRSFPKVPTRVTYTCKVRRLLYMAEFVLLLNYVEVIIRLVFSIYLVVMYRQPNRDYYAQLDGMDNDQLFLTLKNVMFYCSLQIVSLMVLVLALQRKLGLSPIWQLAFVLEKQFAGAQIKLIFWVLYNVQASLQHSGYDYTFKFQWLQPSTGDNGRG